MGAKEVGAAPSRHRRKGKIDMRFKRKLAKFGSYDDPLKGLNEREEDYKRLRRIYRKLNKLYMRCHQAGDLR